MTKEKAWDYFILVARYLIGFIFLSYGYSKLSDAQFGITEQELNTPIKDLSLFKVSWYLFDHQPFKSVIGIFQIISGLLLLINRTVLIGAFMFIPIAITILIIDISFMPPSFANIFTWRLSFYLILDFIVIWHYKERIVQVWHSLTKDISTKFKFKWWHYTLVPLFVIILEFFGALPRILINLL